MPGEGSIYRSGRWWIAQLSRGGRTSRSYDRRKRATQREAAEALAELKADRRSGVNRSRQTTGEFLIGWVADVRNIRPSTRHGYQVAIERHLVSTLGPIRLAELTPLDVEHALAGLAEGRSAKHLRNIHAVLRRALGHAVRAGLVTRNVAAAEFVDAPRVPDREPDALTIEEIARLLDAARGDWLEAPIRLALGTGLRQGELLGLAWEDLDLAAGRIHVRRELVRRDGRYLRDELKTGSRSRRVLPLAPALVDALLKHRQRIIDEDLVPIATGPVFVTREGRPLNGSWCTHRLYQLLERAGVRRLPWKNLRTTFGSRLFEAGVPDRTIADWLGHRRTTTTHGHYIDTAGGAQARALEAVGALLG
jgi:integrase